jgi:site-specific DNA-methyltransferase (adenine-specific)
MSRVEIIGDARLYLGDSRDILPLPIHAAVTSPPYGEIRDYGGHEIGCLLDIISKLADSISEGGVIMWNVGDQVVGGSESGESFRHALHAMSCGLRLHDTMIYCKEGVSFPDSNRYHPAFEYMFVFSKGSPAHFNGIADWLNKWRGTPPHGTKRLPNGETAKNQDIGFGEPQPIAALGLRRNWWPINNAFRGDNDHPAPMPYSMAFDHIVTWTDPGETVCDPFMGSGTTGVACAETGRAFIGIEIDEGYFDKACRRVEAAQRQQRLFA